MASALWRCPDAKPLAAARKAMRDKHAVPGVGVVTIHARMPTVVELFAERVLKPVGGAPTDVVIGLRTLGPMVLAEVRCTGDGGRNDIVVVVFRRAIAELGR